MMKSNKTTVKPWFFDHYYQVIAVIVTEVLHKKPVIFSFFVTKASLLMLKARI